MVRALSGVGVVRRGQTVWLPVETSALSFKPEGKPPTAEPSPQVSPSVSPWKGPTVGEFRNPGPYPTSTMPFMKGCGEQW